MRIERCSRERSLTKSSLGIASGAHATCRALRASPPEEIWKSMRRDWIRILKKVLLASLAGGKCVVQDEALQSEWDEILSFRAALSCLGACTQYGCHGHSLDAAVRISQSEAGGKRFPTETRRISGTHSAVSAFSCVKIFPGAFLDEESGLRVSVVRAKGENCHAVGIRRSYRRRDFVSRCASVLDSGNETIEKSGFGSNSPVHPDGRFPFFVITSLDGLCSR